jgi:hypothetical protein
MNPRIRAVSVLRGEQVIGTFTLDVARRELQPLRVHGGGTLRIRVDGIAPGSNKAWRETCVSELEAWGTPPPGVRPVPTTPTVAVASPPPRPPPPSDFDTLCAEVDKEIAERQRQRKDRDEVCSRQPPPADVYCGDNEPGLPSCGIDKVAIAHRAAPWREAVVYCVVDDVHYGSKTCELLVRAEEVIAAASETGLAVGPDLAVQDASVRDVLAAPGAELVVRYTVGDRASLVVCRASPTPACARPVALTGDDWTAQARFDRGELVVEATTGHPPADALGRRALVFP